MTKAMEDTMKKAVKGSYGESCEGRVFEGSV